MQHWYTLCWLVQSSKPHVFYHKVLLQVFKEFWESMLCKIKFLKRIESFESLKWNIFSFIITGISNDHSKILTNQKSVLRSQDKCETLNPQWFMMKYCKIHRKYDCVRQAICDVIWENLSHVRKDETAKQSKLTL